MDMSNGVLSLMGIGIAGGAVGGTIFKKLKIPQVLGYIAAGLLVGQTGFKIVSLADVEMLKMFNLFALSIIGFLVGAEIKLETFQKYGKQFSSILFAEGLSAFFLTGFFTGLIIFLVSHSLTAAISGGIVLGAIASATDPASTMGVLWEYRTAGILTTTIVAIIALDDALAMFLYGVGSGVSQIISSGAGGALLVHELSSVAVELGGSILFGLMTGVVLTYLFKKTKNYDSAISTASGLLLLVIGITVAVELDVILVAMAASIYLVNKNPIRSKRFVEYVRTISAPVYIFFFVLIGARIDLGSMPSWVWLIIFVYVLTRSIGKAGGATIAAKLSKAPPVVVKYAGLGLFSQGGVAIGLSIMAGQHLHGVQLTEDLNLGDLIVMVVASTTFMVQLIGPAAVKIAALKSGEAGKAISEEDIINERTLAPYIVFDKGQTALPNTTAQDLIKLVSESDIEFIPIVDDNKKFYGVVGIDELRSMLTTPDVWRWFIAVDIMNSSANILSRSISLSDAFKEVEQLQVAQMPVVNENGEYDGVFSKGVTLNRIRAEILSNES